jgi:hypothetical protein
MVGKSSSDTRHIHEIILFTMFLFFLVTQIRNEFTNPDGILLYSHLRSTALDHDIVYYNDFKILGLSPYYFDPSPTGYVQNQGAVGMSILCAPFLLAALAATTLPGVAGVFPGFVGNIPYEALLFSFGSAIFGFLALLVCYRFLARNFAPREAFLAVLFVWLGSSFFYYQFHEATMAHACSAFTTAVYVYLWNGRKANPRLRDWAVLGLVAGFMMTVRSENMILAFLPVIYCALRFKRGAAHTLFKGIPVYAASALVGFSPQMIVFWALNGNPFYSYQEKVNMLWGNPHPLEVLFSTYHGLFVWSPVMLLSVAGWLMFMKRDRAAGISFIFIFLGYLYACGSQILWWGGSAFGVRVFMSMLPLFACGLASFFQNVRGRYSIPAASIFSGCTFMLYLQVLTGKMWLLRYYTISQILANTNEILKQPLQAFSMFFLPKISGVPVIPAAVAMVIASCAVFFAFRFLMGRWKYISLPLLLAVIIAANASLLLSWKNSPRTICKISSEIEKTAQFPLEELYETFPLDYANYYVKSGRLHAGLRDFKRLEKLVPYNPSVPIAEAGIYLALGDKTHARERAAKAASMKIRHPVTQQTLNHILSILNM